MVRSGQASVFNELCTAALPEWRQWIAYADGRPVAAALSFIRDGIAWLGWGEHFLRRGIPPSPGGAAGSILEIMCNTPLVRLARLFADWASRSLAGIERARRRLGPFLPTNTRPTGLRLERCGPKGDDPSIKRLKLGELEERFVAVHVLQPRIHRLMRNT
jgi:hypothetical protein